MGERGGGGEKTEGRTEQIWLLYPAVKRGQKNFKDSRCHGNCMVPALKPHPTPAQTHIDIHVANVFIKIDGSRGVECLLGADLLHNTLFFHLRPFIFPYGY